jgi:hypothetical protein
LGVGLYHQFKDGGKPSVRQELVGHEQDSNQYTGGANGLTCPALATKCWHWDMQATSGAIVDDMSGDSESLAVVNSPLFSRHTSIPLNGEFSKGIYYSGNAAHTAGDGDAGNITTNDFTISAWVRIPIGVAGTNPNLVFKYNVSNRGYQFFYTGTVFRMGITDAGGGSNCSSAVVTVKDGAWHLITIAVDRDDQAFFYFDDQDISVVAACGRTGTLDFSQAMSIGNHGINLNRPWTGTIAEVLIANNLATQAEHNAWYAKFTPPSDVTYAQTTTRKWPLGSDGTFGQVLGVFLGDATYPQWPVSIATSLIDSVKSPLGTGFPGYDATTNVMGRVNEFDQWTEIGSVDCDADANTVEAPDGTMTADKCTVVAGNARVQKDVVGGGVVLAGERWCGSVYSKIISGTCTGLHMHLDGDHTAIQFDMDQVVADGWKRWSFCSSETGEDKGMNIHTKPAASDDCVFALADAQFEAEKITPSCTACTGDSNCSCNASYYAQSWSSKEHYMKDSLARGEIIAVAAADRSSDTSVSNRTLYELGNIATITEGVQPSFVYRNQAGGVEHVVRGKPFQAAEEKREYTASWNHDNELTNTAINAGFAINDSYQPATLSTRSITGTDSMVPASKRDVNAYTVTVGCDSSGANCYNGVIESARYFARPAQKIRVADTKHVITIDTTGPAYLNGASVDKANCLGVAAGNCWIWPLSEFSGTSVYDSSNGIELARSGTPYTGVFTGFVSRGQGRKGTRFLRASAEYVRASANSITNIGSSDTATLSILLSLQGTANNLDVVGSSNGTADAGFGFYIDDFPHYRCCVSDGTNRACGTYNGAAADKSGLYHIACVYERTAGTWLRPKVYINAVQKDTHTFGTLPTGDADNELPFTVGNTGAGTNYFDGEIYEVQVTTTAKTGAQILTDYKRSVHDGRPWVDDANVVAHYYMNESEITNGVGLKDHSGNDNHLTVVNATPDPLYIDAPWPMGSGVNRTSAYIGTSNSEFVDSGAAACDIGTGDFSFSFWARHVDHGIGNPYAVYKGEDGWLAYYSEGSNSWVVRIDTNKNHSFSDADVEHDNLWHFYSFSVDRDGNVTYRRDAESAATTACLTETDLSSTSSFTIGGTSDAASNAWEGSLANVMVLKGYLITQNDHDSLYGAKSPHDDLTYARTSTWSKGICYETIPDPIEGVRVTCFADNQVPYGYLSDLCSLPGNSRMCTGLPMHATVINTIDDSEYISGWSNNNTTDVENAAIAPDGTLTADEVASSAAVATHYVSKTGVNRADGEWETMSYYLKQDPGSTAQWVRIQHGVGAGAHGFFINYDIANYTVGTAGTWGTWWINASSSIHDAGNGWVRLSTTAQCDNGAGCSGTVLIGFLNGDVGGNIPSFGDATTDTIHVWGMQVVVDTHRDGLYCPTSTTASSTCSAPVSNYVAAASISGWDRSNGIIASVIYPGSATGYAFDLHNGTNLNGAVRHISPTTEAWIYNSAGVLQQRVAKTNAVVDATIGTLVVYDSQSAFYDTTRRCYGRNFSSTYTGVWDTYTTDTAANWTAAASTDLWLGSDESAGNQIDGFVASVSVWKR